MKISCSIIGHRRDGDTIRPHLATWRAVCRECGSQLIRLGPKQWKEHDFLDEPDAPTASPPERKADSGGKSCEQLALEMALMLQREEQAASDQVDQLPRDYFFRLYQECLQVVKGRPLAEPPLLLTDRVDDTLLLVHRIED
jgi:hypothetical protein